MDFEALREIWRGDPIRFSKHVLDFDVTDHQHNLLSSVYHNKYTSCKSGHGTGKSTSLAALVWWYLICFDNAQVPCTAPTSDQLRNVLWARISDFYHKMPDYIKDHWQMSIDRIQHRQNSSWFAVARTSRVDNPDALQGFHAENLLIIVDEASGVPDQIFMPVLGALTGTNNKIVLIGNPTRTTGFFYGCFAQETVWKTLTFSAEESPLVAPGQINFWRDRYGVDSDEYRVRVLGEFPSQGDMSLFSKDDIDRSMSLYLEPFDPIIWGVDVAGYGSDETVLAKRYGPVIKEIKKIKGLDTMEVANFIMREYSICLQEQQPQIILLDSVGIGAGVLDRLYEKRYPVKGVNGGNTAVYDETYANLRAEMYCTLRNKLDSCEVKLPPIAELMDQLLSVEYTFDNRGRYRLISKEEMRKRGKKSPDIADAVALTFADVLPTYENIRIKTPRKHYNHCRVI
jgi:hypothetical protein